MNIGFIQLETIKYIIELIAFLAGKKRGVNMPLKLEEKRCWKGVNMVNVYEDDEIIAEVQYSSNLDYWDGNNHTCGSTGRHKGLTKLSDGRFVLIHGTQWQGEKDSAEIIAVEQAMREIMSSGNDELFSEYPELAKLKEKTLISEAN